MIMIMTYIGNCETISIDIALLNTKNPRNKQQINLNFASRLFRIQKEDLDNCNYTE